jgi:hypothetical protein
MFVLWVSLYLYCINASFYMTSLNERHRICLKLKLKIRFRYIINMYIYFIKNKNLIVSWYYNTILRYDTADKKTILPSIPILKTLLHTSAKLVRSVDYLMLNQLLCCCHPCRCHPPKLPKLGNGHAHVVITYVRGPSWSFNMLYIGIKETN